MANNSIGAYAQRGRSEIGAYEYPNPPDPIIPIDPIRTGPNYIGAYRISPKKGSIGAYQSPESLPFGNSIGAYQQDGINDIGAYEGTEWAVVELAWPPNSIGAYNMRGTGDIGAYQSDNDDPITNWNYIGAYMLQYGTNDIGAYQTAPLAPVAPTTTVFVTDVNTTESWTDGDTGLVITGAGFA